MPIDQQKKKNIVIIGGGIIGCTTAYYLTRHPAYNPSLHRITLLEATGIASGASGKAGGLLALWAYPSSIVPLSFRLHAELAREHGGAERWGYRRLGCGELSLKGRKLSRRGGNEVHGDGNGNGNGDRNATQKPAANASASDADVSLGKRSEASLAKMRKAGLPPDLDWFADDSISGAAYEAMGSPADTAQVHPHQFTTAMAALAQERGVSVVLGKCEEILLRGEGVAGVRYLDNGTKEEKTVDDVTDVVVTAGPWTSRVWPAAPIGALRAHSVTIRPTRPVSAYAVFTRIALPAEGGRKRMHVSPEIYARPNDEVYACGEGDTLVPLPETSAEVEADAQRCADIVGYVGAVSDELAGGEVLVRQACYLPQVETGGGPLVGPTGTKGVWMAAGHTCWGIQNGPGTGRVVSEFLFEGEPRSAKVEGLDPRRVM